MRDLRIASSCLTMRAIALGYAHGEEDCPLRHKYMFAAPGKVAYLDCLIVLHGVFKTGVAFSARARYVWLKIRARGGQWLQLLVPPPPPARIYKVPPTGRPNVYNLSSSCSGADMASK